MSEVITPLIKVDVGDSQQTVKGLKKEIAELKDRLLNLTKGSEEYNIAVEELQNNQRKLNEVMALTKKEAVAVEGSYDALTHQMSLLKKEWRATADEAKRGELGKQIDDINQQLKEMDASVGNFQRNVGNYVSHWEGMPEVTQDFNTAMSQMREEIEPTKMKFESIGNIASGLASGFAAVKGAAALLGVENENLEKTFVQLQAAMALAQGIGGMTGLVEGVGKAKVAFQGLGNTIKTVSATMGKTGWLAVLMVVVTAIALVTDKIKKKREEVDTLNDSLNKLDKRNSSIIEADKERAGQLERDIKLMAAQGATEEEILKKRLEYNQLYEDAAKRNSDEAQKQYLGLKDSLSMGIKGVKEEDVDKAKEIYEEANAIYKEYVEKRKNILNDMVIAEIKAKETIKSPTLPVLEDVEIGDADIETTVTKNVEYQYGNGDAEKRANIRIQQAERIANRQIQLNSMVEQSEEQSAERQFQIRQELEQKKLEILKQAYDEAVANGDALGSIELAQQIADKELEIEKAKYDERIRLDEEYKQKKIEITNQINQAITAAGQITQGILEITQAAYEKDGKISEKEAKRIKGLQIAVATMNMLAGITAALSGAFTTKTGPWDIVLAGVQAATIAAAGTANIMKIKNTDLTGSVPTGAMGAVTPNSNIYGTDIPFSYTRQVTGASEVDALNQDTRVYILESDIQASNKRVQIRENESSF
jgi:hypothetical protein